jgi:hypothetical protein
MELADESRGTSPSDILTNPDIAKSRQTSLPDPLETFCFQEASLNESLVGAERLESGSAC